MKVIINATIEMEVNEEMMMEADGFNVGMFKDGAIEISTVQMSILDEDGDEIVTQEELGDAKQKIVNYLQGGKA